MGINWSGVRVVVTGGGGFLGRHVVALLRERGCEPAVPRTSDGWDFRSLDSVQQYFEQTRPEIVFNCAARQGGLEYQRLYPADIFYDNMMMGVNTLHAAQRAGVVKYVNVVAGCSYPGYLQGTMSEDDYWSGPLHDSVVNYGFTKKSQVVQGWCYKRQYDFNSVHLLVTNLYGPGEHFHPDRSHGLAALLRKCYEAKRCGAPHIVVWGTGKPVREWLYVGDAAEALLMAAEKYDDVTPLNVSVGQGISIADLASLIADVVGYTGQIVYDRDKPDGALMKTFSNVRMMEKVGWRPRTPIREGVLRTLKWLDANYEYAIKEHRPEAARQRLAAFSSSQPRHTVSEGANLTSTAP